MEFLKSKKSKDQKPTRFFVQYNFQFLASFKSLTCALNFVRRKDLCVGLDNTLWIVDNYGTMYHPFNGIKL